MPRPRKLASSCRYFNVPLVVTPLVVMMCARFPLSPSEVEDLLFRRDRHLP
jgi:hypothetical protein